MAQHRARWPHCCAREGLARAGSQSLRTLGSPDKEKTCTRTAVRPGRWHITFSDLNISCQSSALPTPAHRHMVTHPRTAGRGLQNRWPDHQERDPHHIPRRPLAASRQHSLGYRSRVWLHLDRMDARRPPRQRDSNRDTRRPYRKYKGKCRQPWRSLPTGHQRTGSGLPASPCPTRMPFSLVAALQIPIWYPYVLTGSGPEAALSPTP